MCVSVCVSKRKMLTDYCTQQLCSDCTVCHSALWFCSYCKDLRPWLVLIAAAIAWTPSSCSRFAVRLTHTHTHKYTETSYSALPNAPNWDTNNLRRQMAHQEKWLRRGDIWTGVYCVSAQVYNQQKNWGNSLKVLQGAVFLEGFGHVLCPLYTYGVLPQTNNWENKRKCLKGLQKINVNWHQGNLRCIWHPVRTQRQAKYVWYVNIKQQICGGAVLLWSLSSAFIC